MSETSGCAWNVPCAGFSSAKIAAGDRQHDGGRDQHLERARSRRRAAPRARRDRRGHVRLPRLDGDEPRFFGQPHAPSPAAASRRGLAPRDEHLDDERVVRVGRQRLDRPAADVDRARRRRGAAAEPHAVDVDVVHVAVGVGLERARRRRREAHRRAARRAAHSPVASNAAVLVVRSLSGSPSMSKPQVRPRSCSIFCSARIAVDVPVPRALVRLRREREELRQRHERDDEQPDGHQHLDEREPRLATAAVILPTPFTWIAARTRSSARRAVLRCSERDRRAVRRNRRPRTAARRARVHRAVRPELERLASR